MHNSNTTKKSRRAFLEYLRAQLITRRIFVFVNLAGARRIGEVLGLNHKSTWVRIKQGATSYIVINRHNMKDNVVYYKEEGILKDETVHTTTENETGGLEAMASVVAQGEKEQVVVETP